MASFYNLQFVKKCFGLRFSLQSTTLIGNSQVIYYKHLIMFLYAAYAYTLKHLKTNCLIYRINLKLFKIKIKNTDYSCKLG